MIMNTKLLYQFTIIIISLTFISCDDRSFYPKVNESISVINKTDTLFFVEYGFIIDSNSTRKDSVYSHSATLQYINNETNNLWLKESDFEAIIAKIRIYRIEENDTSFVDKNFYNKRAQWNYQFNRYTDSQIFANFNSIVITSEMFTK